MNQVFWMSTVQLPELESTELISFSAGEMGNGQQCCYVLLRHSMCTFQYCDFIFYTCLCIFFTLPRFSTAISLLLMN